MAWSVVPKQKSEGEQRSQVKHKLRHVPAKELESIQAFIIELR